MQVVKAITTVTGDTTANWNKYKTFIPMKNELIVYTDRYTETDENGKEVKIPGFKVGDGNAYLIDLPFIGSKADNSGLDVEELQKLVDTHAKNTEIHVTKEEKEFWNNKLNYEVSGETLIFKTK